MKIWLDDVRTPPDTSWTWCKNFKDCANLIRSNNHNIDFISFDHDLGEGSGTGYDVAYLIETLAYYSGIKPFKWDIHSQNPVGAEYIRKSLMKTEQYWQRDFLK